MIDNHQNPNQNSHTRSDYQRQAEQSARPGIDPRGRLEASVERLQQSAGALAIGNEQFERLADRLTGEVPTSASVSKLNGHPPQQQSIAHAIDMACEQIEAQVSRQAVVLQRLGQL